MLQNGQCQRERLVHKQLTKPSPTHAPHWLPAAWRAKQRRRLSCHCWKNSACWKRLPSKVRRKPAAAARVRAHHCHLACCSLCMSAFAACAPWQRARLADRCSLVGTAAHRRRSAVALTGFLFPAARTGLVQQREQVRRRALPPPPPKKNKKTKKHFPPFPLKKQLRALPPPKNHD